MEPRAGVVVVHYGPAEPTVACVRSIVADPSPVARSIVVVDNSGDLDAAAVAPAVVVSCPDNPGFGAGANRGVAALAGQQVGVIVVLNHDVEIQPGFLAAAAAAVDRAGVGAAGGPLYLDDGRGALWYAGGGVSFATGTVWQSRSRRAARRRRAVGFIPGAAVALAPAAWERVRGFDPEFFLYNEDLDLCLRLRRAGLTLRFEPGMVAVHRLGATTGSGRVSPLYLENLARTRLRPFRPLALRCYLALLHTGYVLLRAATHVVRGRGGLVAARALLRGHRAALAGIRRGPLPV